MADISGNQNSEWDHRGFQFIPPVYRQSQSNKDSVTQGVLSEVQRMPLSKTLFQTYSLMLENPSLELYFFGISHV